MNLNGMLDAFFILFFSYSEFLVESWLDFPSTDLFEVQIGSYTCLDPY